MTPKRTRTEKAIRKHFNIPENAELIYNNKAFKKGPDGSLLRGWFLNKTGSLLYLGRGINHAKQIAHLEDAIIVPRINVVLIQPLMENITICACCLETKVFSDDLIPTLCS